MRPESDGQYAVAARELLRDQSERFGIRNHLRKVDRFLADGTRHNVANDDLGYEAEPHEQASERDVVVALLGERDRQLIARDQPLLNQQLAQPAFPALFFRDRVHLFSLRRETADARLGIRQIEVGAALQLCELLGPSIEL